MPSCSVKKCKNRHTKDKITEGISFHRFPKDPVLRDKWTKLVQIQRGDGYWSPSETSILCSSHFSKNFLYVTSKGYHRIKQIAIPDLLKVPNNSTNESVLSATNEKNERNVINENRTANAMYANEMNEDTLEDVDITDQEAIFFTPREQRMEKEIERLNTLKCKHRLRIDNLLKQNKRLKRRNNSLQHILKILVKKNYVCN